MDLFCDSIKGGGWWKRVGEVATGPPGPGIDHVYVGHLTQLGRPSPSMCQISRAVTRCAAGDEASRRSTGRGDAMEPSADRNRPD